MPLNSFTKEYSKEVGGVITVRSVFVVVISFVDTTLHHLSIVERSVAIYNQSKNPNRVNKNTPTLRFTKITSKHENAEMADNISGLNYLFLTVMT